MAFQDALLADLHELDLELGQAIEACREAKQRASRAAPRSRRRGSGRPISLGLLALFSGENPFETAYGGAAGGQECAKHCLAQHGTNQSLAYKQCLERCLERNGF